MTDYLKLMSDLHTWAAGKPEPIRNHVEIIGKQVRLLAQFPHSKALAAVVALSVARLATQ